MTKLLLLLLTMAIKNSITILHNGTTRSNIVVTTALITQHKLLLNDQLQ